LPLASPSVAWRNEQVFSARAIIDRASLRKVYAIQHNNLLRQQQIVLLPVRSYGIRQTLMEDLLTSKNRLIDAKNALMNTTNRLSLLTRQFVWQRGAPLAAPRSLKNVQNKSLAFPAPVA